MRSCIVIICLLASWGFAADEGPVVSLDGARIGTEAQARAAAVQASTRDHLFDLKAEEAPSAALLFRIGFPVSKFARTGDRIWQVHFIAFERAVTKVVWVNAESGKATLLRPQREGSKKPGRSSR